MKIAVPVLNDNVINGHFGKSDKFNIYTISNGAIESVKTIPSFGGSGCRSGIAAVFTEEGVTKVIASGIGGGSMNKLKAAGIEIISGCKGSPRENIELLLRGELADSGSSCHKHHDHKHDHKNDHDHNHQSKPVGTELKLVRKNIGS